VQSVQIGTLMARSWHACHGNFPLPSNFETASRRLHAMTEGVCYFLV